jgi:hypothetical protein
MRRVELLTIMALAAVTAARADTVVLSGRVLDRGRPVAGADVATFWSADDGAMKPFNSARTDAEGRFRLEAELYGRDQALMAITSDGARGAMAIARANKPGDPLLLEVEPLVEFRGHFTCDEIGKPPGWTNVYMSLVPGRERVVQCTSRESKFALKLPPGKYEFYGYASFTDFEGVNRQVTLEPGKPVDLRAVDLKQTPIARHYGKEPPQWHVTDARGVPQGKNVTIADFKGKWVILEFWGFW